MVEYTLTTIYDFIYRISNHLEMHIVTRNNPKKPLGMNIPEIRATLATRHIAKTNKSRTYKEKEKYGPHQNSGLNPCAHEG
jgi:hypothetical protein